MSGERNWKAREKDELHFFDIIFSIFWKMIQYEHIIYFFLTDKIIPSGGGEDTTPRIVLELKESSINTLNLIKVSEATPNNYVNDNI